MSNTIGEKFKLIRNKIGLSQSDFAALVGISVSSYKKYETGHSEVGAPPLLAVANNTQCKKYALWLVTGETNPAAGQHSPLDDEQVKTYSTVDFETQFIESVGESLMTFGYFGWIDINKDKIDFDACGKYMFKQISPYIDAVNIGVHKKASSS